MKNDSGFKQLTVPKVLALSSEKGNDKNIRTVYRDLLCVWGLSKLPFELETSFREVNRQEMIYHPFFQPSKVTLIYCDALLAIKGDIINIYMGNDNVSVTDNVVCCFLHALYIALHGFGYQDYLVEYDREISNSHSIKTLKELVMLWSGSRIMQGYHPVIWGLGTGYSDSNLAEEIMDIRIKHTKRSIDGYLYINRTTTQESSKLLFGMLFDLGMFYAYNEIMLALLQGSFNPDFFDIVKKYGS